MDVNLTGENIYEFNVLVFEQYDYLVLKNTIRVILIILLVLITIIKNNQYFTSIAYKNSKNNKKSKSHQLYFKSLSLKIY